MARLHQTTAKTNKMTENLSATHLLKTHFDIVQVFGIDVIRAEDQVLAETSFEFFQDDTDEPFLLAG